MRSRRSIGPSSVGPLSQRENFRAQRSDAQTGQFGQSPSYGLPATDTGGLHAPGQHLARFAAAFGLRFVAAPGFAGRETASAIRPRLGPASENRLPARIARSTRFARRQKRPPPPARYHFAVGRKLDLAGSARFRTDLQQAILEAADPLRNGRGGTDPLLPRKQLGLTVASYIYFLGDAAVNYRYDASPVKKATTLATIFPGAGQVYNKSYWKLPFVVGGLATTIYTIDWNNRGYQRFKKAYSLRSAYDKALEAYQKDPENNPDPGKSKDEFGGRYSAEFLKNLKDNYRRNRDLCIIITAGLYVLQIIDAHVDAHLKSYDISDDLSVEFTPAVNYVYSPTVGGHRPTFGFNFNLNF